MIRIFNRPNAASVATAARYDLQNTPNVYHIAEWALYKDFTASKTPDDLSKLFEAQVHDYDKWLRTISPTLTFYDTEWRQDITLDYDIVRRFMTFAMREMVQSGDIEIMKWFKAYDHTYDTSEVPYVLFTLCKLKKAEAAHLVLDLWTDMPMRTRYLRTRELVREASRSDVGLARRIQERAAIQVSPKLR
jgi:hypothetical protein